MDAKMKKALCDKDP
jgi:AP-4 complex subunit epsilon-1